jgi:hypothetical protein
MQVKQESLDMRDKDRVFFFFFFEFVFRAWMYTDCDRWFELLSRWGGVCGGVW